VIVPEWCIVPAAHSGFAYSGARRADHPYRRRRGRTPSYGEHPPRRSRHHASCASSPTTNHSRQVMDRLYRQRYSDPPLNERVLRAYGESRRRMPPSPLTAPGVPRPVGGRPREHLARSPGVELLRLSRPQSVYRTDLLHNDVRLRPAVPAEHVDQFHPQMLEVA
jgi:hypothetical protein